jgi:hypothetical protein
MTKPTITTRTGKGAALTYQELDDNFSNIKDATITLTGGSTAVTADLNGNITLVAGSNVTITGDNTAKTITINSVASGSMNNFTVAGDSGTSQPIADGNTLTISGGTGLSSVASATDTVTLNLDNTAVTAGSYQFANITVDAQGRITAASSPSFIALPIGTFGSGSVVMWRTEEAHNTVTLTAGGTWNLNNTYPQRTLTMIGSQTFTATSGVDFPPGSRVINVIRQDATGNRVATWASNILFEGGVNPTLSTAPYAKDLLIVYNIGESDDTSFFFATLQKGFA